MTSALLVAMVLGQLKLGPGGFQCPAGYAIQVYTGTRDKGRCVAVGGSGGGSGLPADPAACPAGQYVTDQNASGVLSCSTPPSGGTPAGSTTQVQFNDGGAFGGQSDFTFTKATSLLSVPTLTLTHAAGGVGINLPAWSHIYWGGGNPLIRGLSGDLEFMASGSVISGSKLVVNLDAGHWGDGTAILLQQPLERLKFSLAGTDNYFYSPAGSSVGIRTPGTLTADAGFVGALTGNAATATALAANGGNCTSPQVPLGVDASGAAEGCFTPAGTYSLPDAAAAVKGGLQLAGDLGGTAASPSVVDDSHNHTTTTVSGLDAGADFSAGTLPQARGGTGAGALTCTGTQKLTSNGTAYSCATDADTVYSLPNATTTTLGGVIAPSCSAGSHYASVSAGTLQCVADAGGGGGGMALPYVIAAQSFGGF